MVWNGNTPLFAIYADLSGVPVLVIGGGEVAARKAAVLKEAGAEITVVAPSFVPAFNRLLKAKGGGKLRCLCRPFARKDLRNKRLIFAATSNPRLNVEIAGAARKMGLLVNVAAPPEAGNFQLPATVRRGRFSLAVSTGGASASLAAGWRKRLEELAGPEWGRLVKLLEERRAAVLKRIEDPRARKRVFHKLGSLRWAKVIQRRGAAVAGRQMDALIAAAERRQFGGSARKAKRMASP